MKNKKWTIIDIPDLTGKVILITGGNSGLGIESAKAFVNKGAEVIITSRSEEKGKKALAEIKNEIPDANITIMLLDLMDLKSVQSFADEFMNKYNRLDVLMNNAGIMMTPYKLSADGFESQMATNHLGHFVLTGLLIDLITKTPDSRIINVSSLAHKFGKMDFDDLFFSDSRKYSPRKAYGRSKLANLLFTYELQRRFDEKNIKTIAVAAHPGASHTNLGNHLVGSFMYKILWPLAKIATQKPADGAKSQIRASVDTNVKGGEYYGPGGFMQMAGRPVIVKSTKKSHNIELAKKLWEKSQKAGKIEYL